MKIDKKTLDSLKKIIKENNSLSDIWVYGNLTDKASDLDLIFVYKNLKKPIKIPQMIKRKVLDGTIIYIPNKFKKDIFLFEKLGIFSVKDGKKISDNISIKFKEFRSLTSFIERYYERRKKLINLKSNFNFAKLRMLKSLIYSYEQFYEYTNIKNIRFKKKNFLEQYKNFRKKHLKISQKKETLSFLTKLIEYDKFFCEETIKILDKEFNYKNKINFKYKFNKNVNYNYNIYEQNNIPFVLGQLFNYYAFKNLELSKKIRSDFFPKKKFYKFTNNFEKYLDKKILFLNKCFIDLKKMNMKKGMYRLTWYL